MFGELMPHPRDAVIAETAHHDALSQLCRKESLPVNLWTGEHKKPVWIQPVDATSQSTGFPEQDDLLVTTGAT